MAKLIPRLFLLFVLAACYHNAREPKFDMALIVPPDSMVSVLTDIHLLDAIANYSGLRDSAKTNLIRQKYDLVLTRHHMDRKAFEENIHYYAYHAEELDKIYEQVINNLSKEESEVSAAKDTLRK